MRQLYQRKREKTNTKQYYSINKPFTHLFKNRLFCQGRTEIQWERGGSRMKLITMLITMGEAKYDILFFYIQE